MEKMKIFRNDLSAFDKVGQSLDPLWHKFLVTCKVENQKETSAWELVWISEIHKDQLYSGNKMPYPFHVLEIVGGFIFWMIQVDAVSKRQENKIKVGGHECRWLLASFVKVQKLILKECVSSVEENKFKQTQSIIRPLVSILNRERCVLFVHKHWKYTFVHWKHLPT